jgi:hypothetical protein
VLLNFPDSIAGFVYKKARMSGIDHCIIFDGNIDKVSGPCDLLEQKNPGH